MSFLNKYKALSEEAKSSLKAQIANDPELKLKVKGQIDSLSAADREELKSLMTGQAIDLSKVPQGQTDVAVERELKLQNESFNKEGGSVFEAVTDTLGAVGQGVIDVAIGTAKSIPFGDVISGHANAIAEEGVALFTGDETPYNERVIKNKKLFHEGIREATERSPYLVGGGELLGTVAQVAVPAAKAASAAGKVAKAIGASEKAVRASQIGAVAGTDFIVGALQIEATKGEHGVESFAESMEKSAMYTAFGAGLGVTVSKGVPVLAKWAANKSLKTLQASRGSQKLFSEVKKFVSRSKLNDAVDTVIDEDAYVEVLSRVPGYNDAIKAGDALGAGKLVKAQHGRLVDRKSSIFNALDVAGLKANKQSVVDTLEVMKDELAEGISKGSVTLTKARQNYLLNTIETLKQFPEEQISLERVNGLLDEFQYVSKKLGDGVGDQLLGRLRNNVNGVIKRASESSDEALATLGKDFIEVNKALRVTYHNSQATQKLASELNDMSSRGVVGQVMSDVAESLSTVKGALSATFSSGLSVLHAAGKSAGALRTIVNGVEGAERGIQKLQSTTDFFTIGSGRHSKTGQTLISALGRTLLEDPSGDELAQKIEDLNNAQLLLQKPMDRTSASFMAKKDALIPLVTSLAPEIGEQLTSIVKNGENIGPFMEQVANHPAAKEIFTPGQGWDGKTYDPALKDAISSQIDLLPHSVGSGALKKKIKEDLMVSGTIPDLSQIPKRQPRRQ